MKYLFRFLLIILVFNFSCSNNKKVEKSDEIIDSVIVDPDRIVSNIGETLIPSAKRALNDWKEYQNFDNFIIKYYNVSILEALNNANELATLTQELKDSIRVNKLEVNNVVARLNVLHNEALRLNDMATIRSITDEEVKDEVKKILEVYSAVNSKINTIYKTEDLKESLGIDPEILKDSIVKKQLPIRKRPISRSRLNRKQ
jgi:hypothetical protein